MLAGVLLLALAGCAKPDNPTPAPSPTPTPTPTPPPTPTPVIEVPPASQTIFTSGISFNSGTTNPGDAPATGTGTEPASEQPQTQVVTFTAPTAWTASVEETKAVDWLEVVPSSGAAGAVEMKVTAKPNLTYEDRVAKVTIKSGDATASFSVKQVGKPRPVEVTEVKVDMTEVSLTEGESVTLIAMVSPDNATDKTVTWSSSNPAVATVNEGGKVTAVAAGEAVITAKAGEKTAACKVIVNAMPAPQPQPQPQPQPEPPVPVGVSSIVLDQTNLILQLGSGVTLVATVGPENAVDKTVTWESSNPAVATVDENGRVTTVGIGEAVITAKAGEKSATCKVTVNAVPVSSISLDKTELELKIGESYTLVATVGPGNATDKTVTWSSSDTTIATVDASGKVTAVRAGRATITAKAGDQTATCAVKVPVPAGGTEGMGEEQWN